MNMRFSVPVIFLFSIFLFACRSEETKEESEGKTEEQVVVPDTLSQKRSPLPDSLMIGELTEGSVNVYDTVNGKALFSLYDGVPVATTEAANQWIQVGVIADLNPQQFDSGGLAKGDRIVFAGREVGVALDKLGLHSRSETNNGLKGEIVGYASVRHIKPGTIPELALGKMINEDKVVELDQFLQFFYTAGFHKSDGKTLTGFQLDENWIEDPSPLIRLWVLFKGEQLLGIVHSRKLQISDSQTTKLSRGFSLTIVGQQDQADVNSFVQEFNSFITQAD